MDTVGHQAKFISTNFGLLSYESAIELLSQIENVTIWNKFIIKDEIAKEWLKSCGVITKETRKGFVEIDENKRLQLFQVVASSWEKGETISGN